MRPKLSIFTDFADTLFLHNWYLMAVQNFSKPLNLKILKQHTTITHQVKTT